jgi:hypothetical protein
MRDAGCGMRDARNAPGFFSPRISNRASRIIEFLSTDFRRNFSAFHTRSIRRK